MTLGYVMVTSLFVFMLVAGVGIVLRGGWARPWIVVTSLLTLRMSLWPPSLARKVMGGALVMFRHVPNVTTAARLVYLVVPPVTATLALGWLVLQGGRWLPSTPRHHWVAALLWVGMMVGIVFW
jgi:hypothetical protein